MKPMKLTTNAKTMKKFENLLLPSGQCFQLLGKADSGYLNWHQNKLRHLHFPSLTTANSKLPPPTIWQAHQVTKTIKSLIILFTIIIITIIIITHLTKKTKSSMEVGRAGSNHHQQHPDEVDTWHNIWGWILARLGSRISWENQCLTFIKLSFFQALSSWLLKSYF